MYYSDRTIKEGAEDKFALVEFTNYDAMLAAMRLNNTMVQVNFQSNICNWWNRSKKCKEPKKKL